MNAQSQRDSPIEDEDRNPAVHVRDGPEQVVELYPTENHLFHVVDDVHMESTAQSMKNAGDLVRFSVRPEPKAAMKSFSGTDTSGPTR